MVPRSLVEILANLLLDTAQLTLEFHCDLCPEYVKSLLGRLALPLKICDELTNPSNYVELV
jgi:hypothetical protein